MSLGRNILWNLAAFLWLSLLVVFVTPLMVRKMGLEAFGLWAVITASNGYLIAMDLGLGNALIRFLAAESERGDRRALAGFLRTGITLELVTGTLAGLALVLVSGPLARSWLQVPPAMAEEAVAAFRVSGIAVAMTFAAAAFAAVPAALHRFDLLAVRTFLLLTVQYLFVVLVLYGGGGLLEVVWVYVLGTAGVLAYLVAVSRRLLPDVPVVPGWDSTAVRELARFGRGKFTAQISGTVLQQFDRIALASLLPVGMVSFYAVPLRVSQRIGQVAENVASPFYPAVASHLVAARIDALRRQYRGGARAVALVSGGAVAVLGGLAGPILGVWMGEDFAREGTLPFRLLLLAYASSALFTLPSVAADAAGRPGIPGILLATGAVVHAVILWLAVPRLGLPGAACGVLAGFLIPLLVGVPWIHRSIRALPSLISMLADARGVLLAFLLTAAASGWVSRLSYPGTGAGPLLLTLAGCGLLYLGLLLLLRGLRPDDLRTLIGGLRGEPRETTT